MACRRQLLSFFLMLCHFSQFLRRYGESNMAARVVLASASSLALPAKISTGCLCSSAAGLGFPQDASTGALRGTVVDSIGGRIAGAVVVIVNDATGFRHSVASDSNGQFVFQLLPPGDYSGRATAAGMSPQVTPRLHVAVDGTTEIEFRLTVAGVRRR